MGVPVILENSKWVLAYARTTIDIALALARGRNDELLCVVPA
jgi:hypothetical protein